MKFYKMHDRRKEMREGGREREKGGMKFQRMHDRATRGWQEERYKEMRYTRERQKER
jgi:hypothetical protein